MHMNKNIVTRGVPTIAPVLLALAVMWAGPAVAQEAAPPPSGDIDVSINLNNPDGDSTPLSEPMKIVLLLSVLTLIPSVLLTMTSFTRIVIVLSFVRRALSLQSMPPNQIIIGLALFLTFYIMSPVLVKIATPVFRFQAISWNTVAGV